MRKQYIVAVLALLTLGVVSTYALSYQTGNLTENWDTIYTLQYGTSDLSLLQGSGLETDLGTAGDNDLTITIPASCASAVTPKITVEPLVSGGDGIWTDDDGSYSITVDLQDSTHTSIESKTISLTISGSTDTQITGTATFTVSRDDIAYVVIDFNNPSASAFGEYGGPYSTGFESIYEQLKLTVEDA